MSITQTVGYKGRGPVRKAPYAHPDDLQRLGNNSQLEFQIDIDEQDMLDYEGEGGGIIESDSDVSSVSMALNLLQFSAETMALAQQGTVRDGATAQQTDEAHYGFQGGLTVLSYPPDSAQTITVSENGGAWAGTTAVVAKTTTVAANWVSPGNDHIYECTTAGTTGASEPTWPTDGSTVTDGDAVWTDRGDVATLTKDTDWGVSRAGLLVLEDGKIVDGMPIKSTYTPLANVSIVDALKDASSEYRMVFDGMNRVRSNRVCTIVVHRAKPQPSSVPYISEEFGEMPLTFKVLKDETIASTSNTSQYYQIFWQKAA